MIKFKPKISELEKFRENLKKSLKTEDRNVFKILSWRDKLKKKTKIKTKLINLNECEKWNLDENSNLYHNSGQFFKVQGVKTTGSLNREVASWTQPILTQKHGGVLAFITRITKDKKVEFLINARTEPGDDSDIKLCPSFQATQSNMNKAHGGNLPKFYEIVMKLKNSKLIYSASHNEEGARFWKKTNLNVIVQLNDPTDKRIKGENYKWVTYTQIKKLSLKNNIINPFVKTILFLI
tara:strand:- start:1367 stop:2077 length:711 start_codon:yes stop_codon:yes gene_type:complete